MSEIVKTSSEALPRANAGRTRAQPAPGAVNGAPSGGEGGGGGTTGRTGGAEGGASEFAAVLQEFLAALLERQCRLTGAVAGILYLGASGSRQASIGATFVLPTLPPGDAGPKAVPAAARIGLDQAMVTRLMRYAAEASAGPMGQPKAELMTVQASEARGIYQPDPTHRVLACPLVAADQVHGASVMVVPLAVRMEPTDALERVALTGASYEAFLWRNHCVTEAQTKTRLRETLELLDAAQQSEDAEAMGAIFCHELQRRFGCTRVSIGLIRGSRLRVMGVSGADDLNKHAAVVESLEGVMEECAEQDIEVVFPPPPEDENDPARRRVTRSHAQHSTKFGPTAILSLPLRVSGDLVGVTTMEREPSDPFPAGAVPLLRLAAEFIGPALWTRRMADRGILAVMRDRLSDLASATFGPRHTGAKALVSLILLVFALMAFVPIPGRVTAETETRALVSRTISPPFEGFLEIVNVKPGDVVKEGDVLATLETKDTLVSLTQAGFRLQTMRTQYDHARASGNEGQGDAAIIAARMDEVRGEIQMFEDLIARSQIVSPISGVISRGDIEPLAGAKVEPSQPLFEIIVPGKQVIVVQVKEKDIGRVKVGQEGRMAVTALPDTKLPIKVVRVRPVAEPVQKENVFLVEAEIQEDKLEERYKVKPVDTWLKPGMTGTARLESGTTTVLWELCKPLVEAVRMRVWW